jgi:hypothetical protein
VVPTGAVRLFSKENHLNSLNPAIDTAAMPLEIVQFISKFTQRIVTQATYPTSFLT